MSRIHQTASKPRGGHSRPDDAPMVLRSSWPALLAGDLVDALKGNTPSRVKITGAVTFSEAEVPAVVERLQALTARGALVELSIGKGFQQVDGTASEREIGRLEEVLKKSARQADAARRGLQTSLRRQDLGDRNRPAWLKPGRRDERGQWVYPPGKVFRQPATFWAWRIFRWFLDGLSAEAIAARLAEEGRPNPEGGEPRASSVLVTLRSPAAAGLFGRPAGLTGMEAHAPIRPPLLSWKTYRLVQDALDSRPAGGRSSAVNLLTGRIFCRACEVEGLDAVLTPRMSGGALKLFCPAGHLRSKSGGQAAAVDYERFEEGLLNWLVDKDDFIKELKNPLAIDDAVLTRAIEAFSWPSLGAHRSPHAGQSLEEAARALLGETDPRTPKQYLQDFIAEARAARTGSERKEAMRRKLRAILLRRVHRAYVTVTEPFSGVSEREYLLFQRRPAADLPSPSGTASRSHLVVDLALTDTSGALGASTRCEAVSLPVSELIEEPELTAQAHQEPAMANPVSRAKSRKTLGDLGPWETRLAGIKLPSWDDLEEVSGKGTKVPAIEPGARLASEWAVYQSQHSGKWGLHIDGDALDRAALRLRRSLLRHSGNDPVIDEHAAILALGMPLAFLAFYCRLDLWMSEHLGRQGPETFARVAMSMPRSELSAHDSDARFFVSLLEKVRAGRAGGLGSTEAAGPLRSVFLQQDFSEQLIGGALAALQVVHWADSREPTIAAFSQAYLDWRPLPEQVELIGWRVARDASDDAWGLFDKRVQSAAPGAKRLPTVKGLLAVSVDAVPIEITGSGVIASLL